jgi:release factor glutamine methyltransferase
MSPDRAVILPPAALRPSEYTAALIQVLRAHPEKVRGKHVLEMGSGSGVVLAALAELGAASLCGIDIEEDAVVSGMRLLGDLGHGEAAEFHRGDMWRPVAGRRFDLIVANLPHFPMQRPEVPGRLPTWSTGGPNGRRLLDLFLAGLGDHLVAGGRAVIAHNGFVDLERSRELLAPRNLGLRLVHSTLVYIPAEKLDCMSESVLSAERGRTVHCYGPYAFGEMHVVEIAETGASV